MKEETRAVGKFAGQIQESVGKSRRGFLQKCALVTGAFVIGVFRLDKVIGEDSEDEESAAPELYCCGIEPDRFNKDCLSKEECKASFYWICPWTNERGVRYIIKCVECFTFNLPATIDEATHRCISGVREYPNKVACSVALHPHDKDYRKI